MEKELKGAKEHYGEQYFTEEMADRIKGKVRQRIRQSGNVVDFHRGESSEVSEMMTTSRKNRWSLGKKVSYGFGAAVVLCGLFLGSAFVSPAMAEVAAKIPFLTKIFESKPVNEILWDTFHDKGYNVTGFGYRVDGKIYTVSLGGSEDYYNKVKGEVRELTEDTLQSRGYDDYKVEVVKDNRNKNAATPSDDPREKISDTSMLVLDEVIGKLREQNYEIETYGAGFSNQDTLKLTVDVTIPDTETRKDEIKQAIQEALVAKDIKLEAIKLYEVNLEKQAIEGEWTSKVLPIIWEGLAGKKEFKTKGFAYSFKDDTFKIIIKTTVAGGDSEAQDLARNIQATVREFLNSDQLKPIVKDQPYEIIVRDKSGKNID